MSLEHEPGSMGGDIDPETGQFVDKRAAQAYLERKVPQFETGQDWAEDYLNKPMGKINYRRSGSFKVGRNGLGLRGQYSRFSPTGLPFDIAAAMLLGGEGDEDQWHKLDALQIQTGFVPPKKLDVMKLLPDGYQMYFRPKLRDGEQAQSHASPADRVCMIRGDLARPVTILSILHEIGHCVDFERLSPEGKSEFNMCRYSYQAAINGEKKDNPDETQDIAQVILQERNAWAFALKSLRKFITREIKPAVFPKQYLLEHIHRYALLSYGEKIAPKIDEDLTEFVSDFLNDDNVDDDYSSEFSA